MIFRRIKAHIAKEDWFAVFIDFCIVVFGVFMGFQVQEWAVEQNRRADETIYLERLHGEVVQLTEYRLIFNNAQIDNQDALTRVVDVLQNRTDQEILTNVECNAIIESHIYSKPAADLPTLDELLSTGQFNALSNTGVKLAITRLNQSARRADDVIAAVNTYNAPLSNDFPELIQVETRVDGRRESFTDMIGRCDVKAMKANQHFLNTFAGHRDRFRAYVENAVKPVSERLKELHTELDNELDIIHEEPELAK